MINVLNCIDQLLLFYVAYFKSGSCWFVVKGCSVKYGSINLGYTMFIYFPGMF